MTQSTTIPGTTLEAFLLWIFSLKVIDSDQSSSVPTFGIRQIHFDAFVKDFEAYREQIENKLKAYPEDATDFRPYQEQIELSIPAALYVEASLHLMTVSQRLDYKKGEAIEQETTAVVPKRMVW